MARDILALVEAKERQEFCTVAELFKELVQSQTDSFSVLMKLLDLGLLFHGQPPGYIGYDAAIHPSDVKCAISKARKAGKIDVRNNPVPLNWGTPSESDEPLHALVIERANYDEVCRKIKLSKPPWPSDAFSAVQNFPAEKQNSTRPATEARRRNAEVRREILAAFLHDMEHRAEGADRNWGRSQMPFTREDFCEVVKRECKALKKTSNSKIIASVRQLGGSFMRGSKTKKDNALRMLYPDSK